MSAGDEAAPRAAPASVRCLGVGGIVRVAYSRICIHSLSSWKSFDQKWEKVCGCHKSVGQIRLQWYHNPRLLSKRIERRPAYWRFGWVRFIIIHGGEFFRKDTLFKEVKKALPLVRMITIQQFGQPGRRAGRRRNTFRFVE